MKLPNLLIFGVIGVLIVLPRAQAQLQKRPSLPNPLALLNTSSTEAIAGNLRAALIQAMPSPLYEDKRHWGLTKEYETTHWRGQGIHVHPEKVRKPKNDGDWRKMRLSADNLPDTLILDLRRLQSPEPGRLTFTIFISFDAGMLYEHQKWKEGVQLWGSSIQARMRVKLTLDCEVTARLDDKGELLPDAIFRLRVTRADLTYDNLVVEHIAGIGGAAAKLMGETAHRLVHEFKPHLERELIAKADAAIVKAADTKEIRLKFSDLLRRRK